MRFFRSSGRAGGRHLKCAHTSLSKIIFGAFGIVLSVLFASQALATTYTGTNVGAIPDGTGASTCGAPRDVQFSVAGFPGPVGATSVSFTMSPQHDWVGDLRVTLFAPDGTNHLLFARIGTNPADASGDNANFDGTYVFSDLAAGDLWTAAASSAGNGFDIPPGAYRTQAAGPFATDSPGPAFTNMNPVFVTVPEASVNGMWTLRFEDCAGADTGTVSAASLTLVPFASAPVSLTGRVLTSYGAGIRNVMVSIYSGRLAEPKVTYTTTLGYYHFDGLPAGESYIITVTAKRYRFNQPSILVSLDQSMEEVNFTSTY